MTVSLRMIGAGLATAAAPTVAGTRKALAQRRTLFEKVGNFIGQDFAPQVCAFRDPVIGDDLLARLAGLLAEAIADLTNRHLMTDQHYTVALCLPEIHAGEGTQDTCAASVLMAMTTLMNDTACPTLFTAGARRSGLRGSIAALI